MDLILLSGWFTVPVRMKPGGVMIRIRIRRWLLRDWHGSQAWLVHGACVPMGLREAQPQLPPVKTE